MPALQGNAVHIGRPEGEAVKLPANATKVAIHYGEVYIQSPSYPDDERDTWSVWDPRPVRQGARRIGNGLSFADAEAVALKAAHSDPKEKP